jgi:hypothetical protein
MPVTVSDLIHSSFRLIGAIAAGETLETNELDDALVSLNQMLSSWNTEGASLVGRQRLLVNVSTTNFYSLPQRPVKIDAASCSINGVDNPLEIVDAAGWEAIPIPEKAMQSIFIRKLYCDYLFPNSTIYIWPTPRLGGLLELWIYATITEFADVTTTIDLPEGYEAGLRFNLALNLAPEYGRPVDQLVAAQAQNFKASLVQLNTSNHARSAQLALPPVATQGAA